MFGCVGALLGVGGGTLLAALAGATPAPNDLYSVDRLAPLVAFALGVALATAAALVPARYAAALRPTLALSQRPLGIATARANRPLGIASALAFAGGCIALVTLGHTGITTLGIVAGIAFILSTAFAVPLLLALAHRVARSPAARLGPRPRSALQILRARRDASQRR